MSGDVSASAEPADNGGGVTVIPLGTAGRDPVVMSVSNVGNANRARVLQALADHGPLSRADLARMAHVPRASMGAIVAGLLGDGVLEEEAAQPARGRVGKPSRPVWFGAGAGTYGAIAMRAGAVDVALVTARGVILREQRFTLPSGIRTAELDRTVLEWITTVLQPTTEGLRGIGLALPAVFTRSGELVAATTIPALVGSQLPQRVADLFGTPVVLEDDARALAVGQRWFGQARGVTDFAALQIGVGIGAGIMMGGRLHRGVGMVSELGHVTVDMNGQMCRCGLRGCWETVASSRWLRDEARLAGLPGAGRITPATLTVLAESGDERAGELLDRYADHVAVGVVNLFHLLSLPLFILHGEVVGAGERFRERLRLRVRERTMPGLPGPPQVEFASADTNAAVLGAAAAAATFTLGVTV